jgi:predicted acylesterase/phospholipase RssA
MTQIIPKLLINRLYNTERPHAVIEKSAKVQRLPTAEELEYIKQLSWAQDQSIRYVVFSGGGAKGAAYPGAYAALVESGVFKEVEAVAGSSAGAMTAAFAATSIETARFKELAAETNLKVLLGTQGISWPVLLGKDATPMYQLIQKTIAENVGNFFRENKDIQKTFDARGLFMVEQQARLNAERAVLAKKLFKSPEDQVLENKLNKVKEDLTKSHREGVRFEEIANNPAILDDLHSRAVAGEQITFKDLGILRVLDPVRFKDLLVTAVRKKDGKLTIFSPENTPDVEIALAVKASASIPLVFQSVKIGNDRYVDGGVKDNVPLEHFNATQDSSNDSKKLATIKHDHRTITFAFANDGNNRANDAIFSEKKLESSYKGVVKFLVDVVYKFIAGIGGWFQISKKDQDNSQEIRDNATKVVVLDTEDVGTLSFDPATKKSEYLQTKAELESWNHLNNWGIAQGSAVALAQRSFARELYKDIDTKCPKISGKYLEFAEKKAWLDKDPQAVIKDLLALSESDSKTVGLNEVDNPMNLLLTKLNNRATPDVIKCDFMQASGGGGSKLQGAELLAHRFSPESFASEVKPSYQDSVADALYSIVRTVECVGEAAAAA